MIIKIKLLKTMVNTVELLLSLVTGSIIVGGVALVSYIFGRISKEVVGDERTPTLPIGFFVLLVLFGVTALGHIILYG